MRNDRGTIGSRSMVTVSLLLVLVALAGITAVTLAWFSISNHTRVYSMDMDVTTGPSLRFDLDAHGDFADYKQTLGMAEIFGRIRRELGYDPAETPLDPVTTTDGQTFTLRNGTVKEAREGKYLTFTLHFMATEDMQVHLSTAHSREGEDGTSVTSRFSGLPQAMRVSFTCGGQTAVYDPGAGNTARNTGKLRIFGLPAAERMIYNENSNLFHISAYTDTPVTVHIWIEGTDEMCTNELKGGDYAIRLRFVGTDEENVPLGG